MISSQRPLSTQQRNTRDNNPCPQLDSNSQSQSASGCRPTPWTTAWALGSAPFRCTGNNSSYQYSFSSTPNPRKCNDVVTRDPLALLQGSSSFARENRLAAFSRPFGRHYRQLFFLPSVLLHAQHQHINLTLLTNLY